MKLNLCAALILFSVIILSGGQASAADKIFNCPDTGVPFEAIKNVVSVVNPDGSTTEWRISATAFPQSTTQVENWLEAKARHSKVSTELECEAMVTGAENEKTFYTTATTDVEAAWKSCRPASVTGKTNKGLHCFS